MIKEVSAERIALLSILVVTSVDDDLLKPKYRRVAQRHPLFGHCYAATEAMFYLLGGLNKSSYKPQVLRLDPENTHWYLRHWQTANILDLTGAQFEHPIPYSKGNGCGFLTNKPSNRARTIINRVNAKLRQLGEKTVRIPKKS